MKFLKIRQAVAIEVLRAVVGIIRVLNRFWIPNHQQCHPYRHQRKAFRSQAPAIHRLLLDHFNEEFVAPLNKN